MLTVKDVIDLCNLAERNTFLNTTATREVAFHLLCETVVKAIALGVCEDPKECCRRLSSLKFNLGL